MMMAMEEWFTLNFLMMQYIPYLFLKGAISLHYSSRKIIRNVFILVFFHTLAQLRNEHWIPQGRSEVEKSDQFMATVSVNDFKADKLPSMSPWPRKEDAKSAPLTFLTPCTSNSGENLKERFGHIASPVSQSKPSIWN